MLEFIEKNLPEFNWEQEYQPTRDLKFFWYGRGYNGEDRIYVGIELDYFGNYWVGIYRNEQRIKTKEMCENIIDVVEWVYEETRELI